MRSRRRAGRVLAALGAAVVLGAVTGAPAALSAPADWAGSTFSEATLSAHAAENFPIEGTLVRRRASNEAFDRRIQDARLSFTFREGEAERFAPGCIPDATINTAVEKRETLANGTSTMTFALAGEHFTWTCNGTFDIAAIATATPSDSYELKGTIRVAVPPVAVPAVTAAVGDGDAAPDPATGATADDPATIAVSWEQLENPDEQYVDFVGYRVQRAGPAGDSAFETVSGVIGHQDDPVYSDTIEAPGSYRYRVQSLRAGPDGAATPVPSTADTTPTAEVEVAGPAATTTTTTTVPANDATVSQRRTLTLPHVSRSKTSGSTRTVPTTTTTLDTGFDEELDYGDNEDQEPGDELADGGQSIIRNEGESAGLLGPFAGAMVLLGWAGHVAYLNRLAKQF